MSDESPSPSPEETAVREYLVWITDPTQLIDAELVARLEGEAATVTDPIAKLRALSRLEHAKAVDGERFKLSFIKHAKQWADDNQITAAAFRELGVDDTILRAAGIGLSAGSGRDKRLAPPAGSTTTIRSVSSGQIKAEVSAWVGEFTLGDVVTKVGGSPMTVRKAVDELVETGVVHRLGPLQHHTGRGRAPIVYRVR
jgi:hypothetical protein